MRVRLAGLACGLVAAGVALGNTAVPAAGSPHSGLAVPAPGCSTAVTTAPALTKIKTTFIRTPGGFPFGVAFSPDSKFAFVTQNGGPLLVYSVATGSVKTDTLGRDVSGLAIAKGGRYLVAAEGSGAMVLDATQLETANSHATSVFVGEWTTSGSGAIEAAVSPDGDYAFVTLEGSDQLAVFNMRRALSEGFSPSDLIGTVPLGVAPVGIAISPGGHYLYVTSESASQSADQGTLTTIDLAKVAHHLSGAIVSAVPAGCSPVRVVATSSNVYVTARGSDAVLGFSAPDLVSHPGAALQEEVRVGEAPVGLALIDRDKALVVADSNRFGAPGAAANLAVISIAKGGDLTLVGYLASGLFPRDMAASHNGKTLWVSNFGSGQVESVDVGALRVELGR